MKPERTLYNSDQEQAIEIVKLQSEMKNVNHRLNQIENTINEANENTQKSFDQLNSKLDDHFKSIALTTARVSVLEEKTNNHIEPNIKVCQNKIDFLDKKTQQNSILLAKYGVVIAGIIGLIEYLPQIISFLRGH